jgi:Uma2 family endonuclease
VPLVWLVDPETNTVLEYRGSLRGTEYDESDTITGGDVLPEFTCRVADFFQ